MRILALLLLFSITACELDEAPAGLQDGYGVFETPTHFPPMEIPRDNAITPERVALGKRLFYDPILSRDVSISCSSCHHQELAFADEMQLSEGVEGRKGFRNAQALINLGWNTSFFRDGGVRTLELQVLAPIADHNEMDFSMEELTERLLEDPSYIAASRLAYGRDLGPFVITRAIAAFERTLVSGNSPYDEYQNGSEAALSESEKRGLQLFFNEKMNCNSCHSGFNFSSQAFENNGLYAVYADSGRMRVTLNPDDRGKFKVPTLRNVAQTGPYMHDGSLQSLESVLDHYAGGGKNHVNQSALVTGFTLSAQEKSDLIAFLEALSDDEFLLNPGFRQDIK